MELNLIQRCQAGDEDAFAQLVTDYQGMVFQTAFLMLDSREDAGDILQEVFIQAHRALRSYDPARGAFSTWLHRITVNRCLNWRRRWKFFGRSLDELPEDDLPAPAVSEAQRAEIESVRQAVGRLSLKLRAVIILRYFWELSYNEIAAILDLPAGTVKSRLNLALRELHTGLAGEYSPGVLPAAEVTE